MYPVVLVVLSCIALIAAITALYRAWTDHARYESEICRLRGEVGEARAQLARRGLLANEIAHEIKNPITAILCSVDTLDHLLGETLQKEHRKSLWYIKDFGENLLRLVSDFIDITRAETGNLEARAGVVEVQTSIETTLGLLESTAIRRQVTISFKKGSEEIFAFVDPKHLKQILFNLLHNAIKFSRRDGVIEIGIVSAYPDPFVTILIRDNGLGIPEEKLARIFDPYARFANAEPDGEGIGLGLPLCQSLIGLAHGRLSLESALGVGTTAEIRIPSHHERAPRSPNDQYYVEVPQSTEGKQLLQ